MPSQKKVLSISDQDFFKLNKENHLDEYLVLEAASNFYKKGNLTIGIAKEDPLPFKDFLERLMLARKVLNMLAPEALSVMTTVHPVIGVDNTSLLIDNNFSNAMVVAKEFEQQTSLYGKEYLYAFNCELSKTDDEKKLLTTLLNIIVVQGNEKRTISKNTLWLTYPC